jgi:murein DD-endopeptidase MepM/ murein hydrolase activator NlpD
MFFSKKKNKYILDPITLTIRKVEKETVRFLRQLFTQLSIAFFLGFFWAFLFIKYFSSPAERKLERELKERQMKVLTLQQALEEIASVYAELKEKDNRIYRSIFALPLTDDKYKAGIGGTDTARMNVQMMNDPMLIKLIRTVMNLGIQAGIQEQSFKELAQFARNKEKMLKSIPSIMPVNRKLVKISSGFGWRYLPGRGGQFHTGVDFAGHIGIPIFATGDGVVEDANLNASFAGYGLIVLINHGFGFKTLYAHLSKVLVKPGDSVKRGQIIGYMGSTGYSTGPHLHYEVIRNGQKVNPINYIFEGLSEEEYRQIFKEAEEGNNILS